MLWKLFLFFRRLDIYLLGLSVLLAAVGMLMIYSMTYSANSGSTFLPRQLIFFLAGLVSLFIFSGLNYRYLYKISWLAYVVCLGLLAGVLIFGLNIKGSLRWFDLGFLQLQPVELTKIGLILLLSAFFQKRINRINRFRTVVVSGLLVAAPVGLTLAQPDLGSALVLACIWLGILLVTGVKKSYLLWLLLFFVVAASFTWVYVFKDYQKDRIFSFVNPTADPQGRGYNARQSVIAVGSGGLFGRGLARGVVSGLRFLPERQTDFIFASLAEELGFVGATFLLLLLLAFFYRVIKIINGTTDNFGLFVSVGIFCYLFFQTAINVGMNIGIVPITGIPLPLVSYGGSSMVTALTAIGILQSITSHSSPPRSD